MRTPALLLSFQLVLLGNLDWSHGRKRGCDCMEGAGDTQHRTHDLGAAFEHAHRGRHGCRGGHGCRRGHECRGGHCDTTHAACHVQPNARVTELSASNITGEIHIRMQRGNGTEIFLDLHGFPTTGKAHGIHVHEYGDLSGGCETLGGHFNPHNMKHGSHAGDLGNFRPGADGTLRQLLPDVPLILHGPHSIIGRSIVIHENEDDLGRHEDTGSPVHGNAGPCLARCVIGVSSGRGWPEGARTPAGGDGSRK